MEQMQEQEEKKTLEEMHKAAYGPMRWGAKFEHGEWSDDDADCFCD